MQISITPQRTNSYDKSPTDRVFRSNSSRASRYPNQRKSRVATTDKVNQLARDDRGRHEHQSFQGQSPRRARATLPRTPRSRCPDVSQANHLPTSRGPDRTLRTGQIPLQLDGFKLEPRSHYNFRFHSDAWLRRNGHFQSPVLNKGSRDWDIGFFKVDVRYDSARSDDPLSQRSGTYEEIFRAGQQGFEKSRRQVFKNQRQDQRALRQDQSSGEMLAPLCQGQRGQGTRRQEDLSSNKSNSAIAKRLLVTREKSSRQRRTRTGETIGCYGKAVAADQVFSGNGICRFEENNSFADVGAVLDCSRQSRQIGGVRAQVGNQSNRWFCFRISARQQRQCFRQEVLFASGPRARLCFWQSTRDLRLRPWWLQQGQSQENKKYRGQTCRHSSDWQSQMGGVRSDVGKNQARAGPSRGNNWRREIKKIWIQQTECQINTGNGVVWPSLVLGLQSVQCSQKTGSARNGDGIVIEALWAESTDDRVFHKFSTQIQRELWKTPRFFRSQSPNSLYIDFAEKASG